MNGVPHLFHAIKPFVSLTTEYDHGRNGLIAPG